MLCNNPSSPRTDNRKAAMRTKRNRSINWSGKATILFLLGVLWMVGASRAVKPTLQESQPVERVRWVMTPSDSQHWPMQLMRLKETGPDRATILMEGNVFDEPYLDSGPIEIQAGKDRYIYLVLKTPSPTQVSLFFQKDGATDFNYEQMCLSSQPIYAEGVVWNQSPIGMAE